MKYLLQTFIIVILAGLSSTNLQARQDTTCYTTIQTIQGGFCLQAVAEGIPPFTYTWDNGSVLDYICPNAFGEYCVTITDTDGCAATACDTFGDTPQDSCSVYITDSVTISTGTILYANASGAMPYTFNWSTGELTQSIQPMAEGEYCITITDANGCYNYDCSYYYPNPVDSCGVFISGQNGNASGFLSAIANGSGPLAYLWSTGENTEDIIVQEEGEYCVSITDDNGCLATDCYYYTPFQDTSCYVYLTTIQNGFCLMANNTGNGTYEYIWENGDVGDVFCANAPGTYCVVAVDVNTGCTATACGIIEDPNVDSCGLVIALVSNPAYDELSAIANGTPPYTYIWSTGDATQNISVFFEDNYCVTIIDALGCEATECFYYNTNNQDTLCYINSTLLASGDYELTAYGQPNAISTYQWDDGSIAQSVILSPGDIACVTVTDQGGNTCENCYEVQGNFQHNIYGNVYLADSLNNANTYGLAYLYTASSLGTPTTLLEIDTLFFWNGGFSTYYFPNIQQGNYIIQAEFFSDDYAPTYYGDVVYWDEATVVTIPDPDSTSFDIYLIPTEGANFGSGEINGTITDGDNFMEHGEDDRSAENPIAGATVFAVDMNGNVAGFDVTNDAGYYNIAGLTAGEYSLCVDYIGQTHFCEMVTLADGEIISFGFYINEGGINTGVENIAFGKAISISPNPANELLQITLDKGKITRVHIFSAMGVLVSTMKNINKHRTEINVAHLEAGMYFIEFSNGQKNTSKKFIKL